MQQKYVPSIVHPPTILLSFFFFAAQTPREVLPKAALLEFQKNYEEPTMDEGFDELQSVQWEFQGNEEERKRWSMWLQVDGK